MKKTALFSFAALVFLSVTTLPNANARGKMPLPPAFGGGNAGAWLGRGPVLQTDSGMIGPGFGSGGSGGGGYAWDPFDDGAMGGSGGGFYVGHGNCWRDPPDSMMGPPTSVCECRQSFNVNYERGVCYTIDDIGQATECDRDGQVGICKPE